MERYSSRLVSHWLSALPSYKLTCERDSFRRTFNDDSKCWMVSSWAFTRLLNLGESSRHPFKSSAGISLVLVDIAVYTRLDTRKMQKEKDQGVWLLLLAHLYTPFRSIGMILDNEYHFVYKHFFSLPIILIVCDSNS